MPRPCTLGQTQLTRQRCVVFRTHLRIAAVTFDRAYTSGRWEHSTPRRSTTPPKLTCCLCVSSIPNDCLNPTHYPPIHRVTEVDNSPQVSLIGQITRFEHHYTAPGVGHLASDLSLTPEPYRDGGSSPDPESTRLQRPVTRTNSIPSIHRPESGHS